MDLREGKHFQNRTEKEKITEKKDERSAPKGTQSKDVLITKIFIL